MISTPRTAYELLRAIGVDHEDAVKIVESREKFEFYMQSLDACMAVLHG
jgi:hypothetical protein